MVVAAVLGAITVALAGDFVEGDKEHEACWTWITGVTMEETKPVIGLANVKNCGWFVGTTKKVFPFGTTAFDGIAQTGTMFCGNWIVGCWGIRFRFVFVFMFEVVIKPVETETVVSFIST